MSLRWRGTLVTATGSSARRPRAPTPSRGNTRRCSISTTRTPRGVACDLGHLRVPGRPARPWPARHRVRTARRGIAVPRPCQLRSHVIGLPAMDLFALVPGLRAVDLDHDCCGIAGTYGLKREKYDIAMAVGGELFAGIDARAPAQVACDSETCRWQIAGATGRPVRPSGRDPRGGLRGRRRSARRATDRTQGACASSSSAPVPSGRSSRGPPRRAAGRRRSSAEASTARRAPRRRCTWFGPMARIARPPRCGGPLGRGSATMPPQPDLVIFAVKQYDLPAALESDLAVLPEVPS